MVGLVPQLGAVGVALEIQKPAEFGSGFAFLSVFDALIRDRDVELSTASPVWQ
jgi:hypothetical protein